VCSSSFHLTPSKCSPPLFFPFFPLSSVEIQYEKFPPSSPRPSLFSPSSPTKILFFFDPPISVLVIPTLPFPLFNFFFDFQFFSSEGNYKFEPLKLPPFSWTVLLSLPRLNTVLPWPLFLVLIRVGFVPSICRDFFPPNDLRELFF